MNSFSFNVLIEHCHNHAVNSLEALSLKMISTEIKMNIEVLFSSGLTRSQVYNEILRNLRSNCNDKLNYHLKDTIKAYFFGIVILCSGLWL